jgi:hypothetical protein
VAEEPQHPFTFGGVPLIPLAKIEIRLQKYLKVNLSVVPSLLIGALQYKITSCSSQYRWGN